MTIRPLKIFEKRSSTVIVLITIAIISMIMHYRVFSLDLMSIHVWRQTETQSTIINFCEEDFNILNPKRNERGNGDGIFRMEFPIMQWIFAIFYKIFGNHVIISRILSFIIGLFSIYGIYELLKSIFKRKFIALLGAWTFNFSPLFYYYTVNPIPDNFALCCSIWGTVFFLKWLHRKKYVNLLESGFFLCLGTLAKLPFILYFSLPFSFIILRAISRGIKKHEVTGAMTLLIFLVPPAIWYINVIPGWHGNGILKGILIHDLESSEIFDILIHNLISTLPELIINYGSLLFFLSGFYFILKNKSYKNEFFPIFVIWGIAIIIYFIFEMNMIGKTHDYYLFPFLPLIFIIVSYGVYNLIMTKKKFIIYCSLLLLMILPLTTYLRMKDRWDPKSPGFNKDLLIYKDNLRRAIPKNELCIAGNDKSHFIFFYYIDKKGWGFDDNRITAKQLQEMIGKGAKYLYSDSRRIDQNPEFMKYFEKEILHKGSIRVIALKQE